MWPQAKRVDKEETVVKMLLNWDGKGRKSESSMFIKATGCQDLLQFRLD